MRYLKGPDFPTGGLVVNVKDDLLNIYHETGSGKLDSMVKWKWKVKRRPPAAGDHRDSVHHDQLPMWENSLTIKPPL